MSPTNTIKMINIQKSYSIHFDSNQSILSSSVHFGFICQWLYLSMVVLLGPLGPHCSYSILQSYSVHIGHFQFIQSTSVHSIHFGPIQSTLVQFSPLWSCLVHFVLFGSICSYSVHMFTLVLICPFILIWSMLILVCPPCSYLSIQSTSFHLVHLCPLQSILVHFGSFL